MEFKNPLAPPPLNQQTSNKPLDTANRALYSNLELLFTKVDTWGLPYYHKYLGAYTALQYYLYVFRLTSQVASSLVTQLEIAITLIAATNQKQIVATNQATIIITNLKTVTIVIVDIKDATATTTLLLMTITVW